MMQTSQQIGQQQPQNNMHMQQHNTGAPPGPPTNNEDKTITYLQQVCYSYFCFVRY